MEWLSRVWLFDAPQTLAIVAALLVATDWVVAGRGLSFVAYVLLATAAVLWLDIEPYVAIAAWAGVLVALLGIHALAWARVLDTRANLRTRRPELSLVGKTGVLCRTRVGWRVRIDGELYPVEDDPRVGFADGLRVRVLTSTDCGLCVERLGLSAE